MEIREGACFDVIVAGAGSAGFTAAVQAGRLGLKTALFEEYGLPGGTLTVMGNNSIDQFNNPHRPKRNRMVIGGIGWEYVNELAKRGFAEIPDMDAEYRVHWQYGVKVNPIAAAQCMDDFLLDANVSLFCHQRVVSVETHTAGEGIVVDSVIVSTQNGLTRHRASVFIDCTGDGDLCAWAGADYVCGSELQPGTLRLYLDHAGASLEGAISADAIWRAKRAGDENLSEMLPGGGFAALLETNGDNINHISDMDSADSNSMTRAGIQARKGVVRLMESMREGGMVNPIVAAAPTVGARESRRIICDRVMTGEEYLAKTQYDDAVCYTYWFVDIHRAGQPAHIVYLRDERTPTISLRAMLPGKLANALVAGRCVCADRECASAIRVKASCMAMGQAVGAAAALFVREGFNTVHAIPSEDVREILRDAGAIVPRAGY